MHPDLLYQIALTLVPNVGCVFAKMLVEHFGDARSIFLAKHKQLLAMPGLGEYRARFISSFKDFSSAEKEIEFIAKHNISTTFLTEQTYPKRLLNCYDSPILLYMKGSTDLNASKIISVVGTRNHSEYGKLMTEKLIEGLAHLDVLVISGLAYGIDGIAHKTALRNHLPTVGVLAHGLDQLYPSSNATLARNMVMEGGALISEFRIGAQPDRHNFPARNRIVAGMCDVVVVIETAVKGGSIITAEIANGYNRDVLAIPGRATDPKSDGCNYLIRTNKAGLLTEPVQLIELMGWDGNRGYAEVRQKTLFLELSQEEEIVVGILKGRDQLHIDEINLRSNLTNSKVAAAILSLELQNVIVSLPGKLYRLT